MVVQAEPGKTSSGSVKASSKLEFIKFEDMDGLNKAIEKYGKVALKFSANFCPPCNTLKKWLEEEYSPKSHTPIFEVETEKRDNEGVMTLCTTFGIRSLPTLIVVRKNLEVVDKITGLNIPSIEASLDKNFS